MAFLKRKRNRPTIGITGPDRGGKMAWIFTSLAVRLAGGKPIHITPSRPRTADGLQALIVGGGADVDPATYQQDDVMEQYLEHIFRQPKKNFFQKAARFTRWLYYPALFLLRKLFSRKRKWGFDKDRDHLEFQLIDQAVTKGLPIMGICRGAQLLNVYFQGTLYQSINAFYLEEPTPSSIFPVKKIYLKPGSKMAEVLGVRQLEVNALHHQAVKDPGKNIAIVAKESNDVVQAIENTQQDFIIGVQWHPEYLLQRKQQRRIFQALIQHAKETKLQIIDQDMQEALAKPRAKVLEDMEKQEEQLLMEMKRN